MVVSKTHEARGYPSGAEGEVHLDVKDDWLERNCGPFVLRVQDGSQTVEYGGSDAVRLHSVASAPLYTGDLSPVEFGRIGLLSVNMAEPAMPRRPRFNRE